MKERLLKCGITPDEFFQVVSGISESDTPDDCKFAAIALLVEECSGKRLQKVA